MQEFLDFIKSCIEKDSFIGVSSNEVSSNHLEYVVDYWQLETTTNELGEDVEIKAGKQKTFTF